MAKQSTHSELQRLFEVAQRDIPTGAEVEQLKLSVLSALSAGVAPRSILPELRRTPHGGRLIKFLISTGMAGLLAAGAIGLRGYWQHAAPMTPSIAPNTSGMPVSGPTSREAPRNEPPPIPSVSQGEPRQVAPEPSAAASSDTSASRTRRAPDKLPVPEAELIEQARQQLQSNPARAWALTQRHRRLYPNGVLAPEREVIAIEALARLGEPQAAQKRAEAFRAAQPHSIHDLHLRSTLGDAGVRRGP